MPTTPEDAENRHVADDIVVVNARENNLKGITLRIPKKRITVVAGVSGSGKSSLVFDTIAAESQRQLNLTFPGYVQQYLPHYGTPEADRISGLPVAMIVDQKPIGGNSRSTVGTFSDIYSLLRLLYSRAGKPFVGYANRFSFNHPDGMCKRCQGLGYVQEIDLRRLIDFDKSLNQGAVRFPTFQPGGWRLTRYTGSGLFDNDLPLRDYPPALLDDLLHAPPRRLDDPPPGWHKSARYEGVLVRLRKSFLNKDSKEARRLAEERMDVAAQTICPDCNGSRLNERIRSCRIGGLSIADCAALPLGECADYLQGIQEPLVRHVVGEAVVRLNSLARLGLGYLTLSRAANTLSGGESQRVKVAKYLNSSLSDLLFIFDEPSSGLHPHDVNLLSATFRSLCEKGNTVLIVEHDRDVIALADHVVEMGPGPGAAGGEITFQGTPTELLDSDTVTGDALRGRTPVKPNPRQPSGWLRLENACRNNLKNIAVDVPLGVLTCLTGVAGSGKTSLSLELADARPDAVRIGQKELTGNVRSTPATYLGLLDTIRALFAEANGVSSSLFSYNSRGGCPACKGKGVVVSDMAFMDEVTAVCEKCGGKRYAENVLQYRYGGLNIIELLDLSVADAARFFAGRDFARPLAHIEEVGLGYLKLNQSLSTLSGGEAQRMKLARRLDEKAGLLILDEPTSGLHITDTERLIAVLDRLVDLGHTLVVIEHDPDVVRQADWVVDLGPGGGAAGGRLLYSCPPAGLAGCKESLTGKYL